MGKFSDTYEAQEEQRIRTKARWDKSTRPFLVCRTIAVSAPAYSIDQVVTCATRAEADELDADARTMRDTRSVTVSQHSEGHKRIVNTWRRGKPSNLA